MEFFGALKEKRDGRNAESLKLRAISSTRTRRRNFIFGKEWAVQFVRFEAEHWKSVDENFKSSESVAQPNKKNGRN